MGDNVVLRFQYSGKDTDVVVDDLDKINLIDLVMDYWERSEKENTPFPKNPVFSYIYKMKQVDVFTDAHLMKMFKDFAGRDMIYIWVGESKKPTTVVEAATKLRELLNHNQPTEPTHVIEPTQPIEPTTQLLSPVIQSTPMQTSEPIPNLISDNMDYWDNIELTPVEPNMGRGRGRGKLRGSGKGRGRGRGGQFSPLFKKRMAKTTAKRKGLWQPQAMLNLNDTLENHETVDFHVDGDFGGSRSGSDENNDNDFEAMSEDIVEYDVGPGGSEGENNGDNNNGEIVIPPYIHDEFDPYEGVIWDDECEDIWDDDGEKMENYLQRLYKNGEFYKEKEFGQIQIKPWQLFTDKQHLREVVRDYCIQSGFAVVVDTANNRKYTVLCNDERCSWRLHAGVLPDKITWAIKSIQNSEHTCMALESKNPMVTAHWAAKALMEDIRANEDIPGKALNELLWNRYKVQMSKSTLYRTKRLALKEIHGGHDVSYSYLPAYCEVVRQTNPDSIALCQWLPENHPERPLSFSRLFIAFKGAVDGFLAGCRGLVGVDGTFLKGNYGGVLLSALALDGNNEIFPIAWAIVSGEDEGTWKFFIHHLKSILQQGGREDNSLCIISDRHKAIDKACSDLWPSVGRRYCTKHLSANFKKMFPGPKMYQLFWLAAGAYSDYTFEKAMKQIDKHKPGARLWLANLGEQERWSKHKFNPNLKSDVNKTNFVESFNATLGVDRTRPVLTLLEGVRRVSMVRMATRRELCDKWDRQDICPNIVKRVQVLCSDSRTCLAYLSGPGEYEIVDGKATLPVSLNHHTCTCNQWQLTGIPCKHGMRAILYSNLDPLKFVNEWYSVRRYKLAYGNSIKPVPDRNQWTATEPSIEPPVMKRRIGRPVKNRRRGEEEKRKGKRSNTLKCSRCGEFGHNCKTCAGGDTEKSKNKAKGKGKARDNGKNIKTKVKQLSLGPNPTTTFKAQSKGGVSTRSSRNRASDT